MSFTEIIFAPFVFLTFFVFYLFRGHPKNQIITLLCASYIFYGWWDVRFLLLIGFSSWVDFYVGQKIFEAKTSQTKKAFLCLSLVSNLGLLGYFKYANFFISSFHSFLELFGFTPHFSTLNIILPVGISFYTFQSLSYSLDIYFGKIKPEKSICRFLFFVAAFPQLVAGPIVRAKDFLPQLNDNLFKKSNEQGLYLIMYGLFKKIILADTLGYYFVDPIFASPTHFSSLELLCGTYFYAFQIFFDFSAYSDIAIGLGLIFGLTLPVNFKSPYMAMNPTDFWRRWHITLSTWLRDYLYIPLGGNRVARYRMFINLMIVMILGGLWHGANWTFVVWGALHGAYLVVYKFVERKGSSGKYNILKNLLFFHLICLTWIFFRSPNINQAIIYLDGLLRFDYSMQSLSIVSTFSMLFVCILVHNVVEVYSSRIQVNFVKWHWILQSIVLFGFLVILSFLSLKGVSHKAFIYFQF